MALNARGRLYLADLVALVFLCALGAGILTSPRGLADAGPYLVGCVVVIALWLSFRSRRSLPTCEECGRPFSRDVRPEPLPDCPHCGAVQAGLQRSLKRWTAAFWALAPAIGACAVTAIVLALDAEKNREPLEGARFTGFAIAAITAGVMCVAMVAIGAQRSRLAQPSERTCEVCGLIIPAKRPAPPVCPNCASLKRSQHETAKEQRKSTRSTIYTLVVWIGLSVFGIGAITRAMLNARDWTGLLPALILPVAILLIAFLLIRLMIRSSKMSKLLTGEGLLANARRCAGEDGTVAQNGPIRIWYSGPEDPVPILRDELAAARRRLETLLGDTDFPDPEISIVCFHTRDALGRFHATIFPGTDVAKHVAVHLPRPWSVITVCTEERPDHLRPWPRTVGGLIELALLGERYVAFPGQWVQSGIAEALGNCGEEARLVQLNRRMIMALSAGTAWSEELFTMGGTKFIRMATGAKDLQSALRAEQFTDQAWSVIEYLCGERTPHPEKDAFRAFLKDKDSRTRREESFFRHFGFGFGSLLEGWRQWVLDQGIGGHEAPPPRARQWLINHVLPVIRDRAAPPKDRIDAIREWRTAGFVLGADTLIGVLRNPGDIPKAEVVWALRMVSGMAWEDDPGRWQAWRDGLPASAIEPVESCATEAQETRSAHSSG
jgi:hypothetical protein